MIARFHLRFGHALSSMLLLICLLWLTTCKDNPEAPVPSEAQSSVMLTAPAPNDVFLPGTNVRITWKLRPGMAAPDSVQLQFRALDPETHWHTVVWRKSSTGEYNMQLADSMTGRFELRIRGNSDEVWDTATPLFSTVVMVRLLSPAQDQLISSKTDLPIRWSLDFPTFPHGYVLKDTGDVEIQYTSLAGALKWESIVIKPATSREHIWKLPKGFEGDITIRIRSTSSDIWSVVTPVHVLYADIRLALPKEGSVFRVGSDIPLQWEALAPPHPQKLVEIEVLVAGSWKPVGTFPYSQMSSTWNPASQKSEKYLFRIRYAGTGDWNTLTSIYTADLRILDFPEGSTLARGSAFKLSTKVDVTWDYKRTVIQLMSTDGGISWPITIPQAPMLIDYPVGSNYRFLIKRDDLSFGDTSARFSVTEHLADLKVLEVGRHYIYEYIEMHWWVYVGSTRISKIDHPDLHILVHDVAVQANKTVYNVSYWNEGSKDTVRTTIEELHEGLHTIVANFMPFSISRICTRTDAASDSVQYRWGDNTLTLMRGRGLTQASTWTGAYPDASEHNFRLK